jgi:hypothetical protein
VREAAGRALYAFPRLDPDVYDIEDDEQLVLDLLLQEKILITQGTGFNWPTPDHLRIVTLPWARDLANAIERLGNFRSATGSSSSSEGLSPPGWGNPWPATRAAGPQTCHRSPWHPSAHQ